MALRSQDSYPKLREKMVKEQIEKRGISDPLTLNAMREVRRHLFVPVSEKRRAYADRALSIGYGQTISQPYVVAFMTEAIGVDESSRVLEIGTGSGYQAAVLAKIVDSVYTIEIVEELGIRAGKTFEDLGYENIHWKIGDGYLGWPEFAPFDAIIVTAAPEDIPPPLIEQLKENGRMIIPVGANSDVQSLLLVTKKDGQLIRESLLPVRFVPFTRK